MTEQICNSCVHEEVCCCAEKYCCDTCKHYFREPKQGEWIDDDINSNEKYHFFKCSVCGGDGVPRCNFCPNCGASMVKEGDEK